MGWRFRRSVKMGPIRWNLSRRGVGASWGIPGFRVGVSADGRRYISVGIPGTGLYYYHYFGRSRSGKPGNSPAPSQVAGPALGPGPSSIAPPASTSVVLPIAVSQQLPRARLVVKRNGVGAKREFNIAERAVVGRAGMSAAGVDVDLAALPEAAYISARHAEIRYEVGVGWIMRDLGSQNGSFLRQPGTTDFHRVVGEEVLRDGDEVSFGNARFEFRSA